MAYNFIPESVDEIQKEIKNEEVSKEIIGLFEQLTSKYPKIKDPLAIDKTKLKEVKIIRSLKFLVDINQINKGLKKIKVELGDGSRGNRGSKNRGNNFEDIFSQDILNWFSGESLIDKTNEPIIEELDKQYNISLIGRDNLTPEPKGKKNTRRPLNFFSSKIFIGKGPVDIGEDVTDIDLMGNGKLIAHLSLKYEGTVSFFNIGTKTVFKIQEIKNGKIENENGKKLLDLLGIDNIRMCGIFKGDRKKVGHENVTNKINKSDLQYFLKSGIGYGYQMIHKISSTKFKCFYIDETYVNKATTIQTVTVYYGGITRPGKRIDVVIQTPKYKLKVNIRDSAGKDGYPDRMMCDYTYN